MGNCKWGSFKGPRRSRAWGSGGGGISREIIVTPHIRGLITIPSVSGSFVAKLLNVQGSMGGPKS